MSEKYKFEPLPMSDLARLGRGPDNTIFFYIRDLAARLEEDGWHWYVHSDYDPRRKMHFHPSQYGDVWELVYYPLYLGRTDGPKAPDKLAIEWMIDECRECRRQLRERPWWLYPNHSDRIRNWLREELTDEQANEIDWRIEEARNHGKKNKV